MDNIMIAVCAGRMLEHNPFVSSADIHVYLKEFEPLGKPCVAIERIEEVLNLMVDAGFMETHSVSEDYPTSYKRFIPQRRGMTKESERGRIDR